MFVDLKNSGLGRVLEVEVSARMSTAGAETKLPLWQTAGWGAGVWCSEPTFRCGALAETDMRDSAWRGALLLCWGRSWLLKTRLTRGWCDRSVPTGEDRLCGRDA
jgi:hypothetical protein